MLHLERIEDFDNLISEGKVVVDFYADWCGPCKMLGPVLEEVSKDHSDIKFLKVNVDDYIDLAKRYGIMSIPAVKVFDNGTLVNSHVGFMDKSEVEELIK